MADVSGLVLTVLGFSFEVASTIYSYAKDVKGAKNEIQQLSNEIFALIGVLERMKVQQSQTASGQSIDQSKVFAQEESQASLVKVLHESLEFLQELHKRLTVPKSRFQSKLQKLTWPLKESETSQHLQRLERVKTYMILSLMTDEVGLTRQIASEIAALSLSASENTRNKREEELRDKHESIIQWLSPVDASQVRDKVARLRTSGSAGAGKTTLITTTLEEVLLNTSEQQKLAYFYCSFSETESLDASNILGSILSQLCNRNDAVYGKLGKLYDEKGSRSFGKPRKLDLRSIVDLIIEQATECQQTCIFIDAVNECNDPYEVLNCLESLVMWPGVRIQICISSINERGIEEHMLKMPALKIETLNHQTMRHDVDLLVRASIADHHRLRQHSPQLKEEIVWTLTRGAQGMFRWVYCQLDLLSRLRTPGAVKAALTSLPPTLDKTYEELLSRIDGDEDRQLAREILELLAFSLRPLNLVEVCEFLQITPGMPQQDESKRLANPKDILSICGNLLNFKGDKNGAITLAHHSVKTYLVSDIKGEAGYFKLSADDAHRNIATKCLTYLSYDAFSDGPCSIYLLNKRYEQFPFLNYASFRWALHTQRLTELDEPVWATLKPFLFSADVGRGNFLAWVQLLIPESKNIAETPPLYYAASFGLTSVVQYLLKGGAEIESRGGRCGASPINIASYRGHVDVVKVLLDHGADPLAPDEHPGWNAIEWAHFKRHSDVSDLFISRGYDIRRSAFDRNAYKEELRVKPRSNRVLDWSSIKPQELMQIQLTPPWHQNQMKRQLWWNLVGLAEGISLNQSGISIFQAAKDRLGLSQNQTIRGEILEVDTSSPNGISANVVPYAGNREEKKEYRVHIGTSVFLISNGITLVADPRELLLPPEDEKSALPSSSFHVVHVGIDRVYAGLIFLSDSKAASTLVGSDGMKITAAGNLNMGTIQEHAS